MTINHRLQENNMQDKLDLAKELIQQSRRLLYTTKEIMAVLDSNERILNSLLAGLERAGPVDVPDVEYDWSKFPEWANYAATDDDGAIWAYELVPPEPDDDDERWYPDWSGKAVRIVHPIGKGHCPHWQSTLRQRPAKTNVVKREIDVWDSAPSWAKWLAMDKNGKWFWYSHKPDCEHQQWWHPVIPMANPVHARFEDCPIGCDNWQTSLMERTNA